MEAKKYPAKDIHRYSRMFFLIGLCLSTGLVICAFEWTSVKPKKIVCELPLPEEIIFVTEPPSPRIEIPRSRSIPIRTVKAIALSPEIIHADPSSEPAHPDFTEPDFIPENPPEADPDTITFRIVEQMPEPVGGLAGYYAFLSKEIKYPLRASRQEIQGKVFIQFVVSEHGNLSDITILKGIGHGCDEEALRVIAKTKWNPGKQRGKPVRVRMVMPVVFKIN